MGMSGNSYAAGDPGSAGRNAAYPFGDRLGGSREDREFAPDRPSPDIRRPSSYSRDPRRPWRSYKAKGNWSLIAAGNRSGSSLPPISFQRSHTRMREKPQGQCSVAIERPLFDIREWPQIFVRIL